MCQKFTDFLHLFIFVFNRFYISNKSRGSDDSFQISGISLLRSELAKLA